MVYKYEEICITTAACECLEEDLTKVTFRLSPGHSLKNQPHSITYHLLPWSEKKCSQRSDHHAKVYFLHSALLFPVMTVGKIFPETSLILSMILTPFINSFPLNVFISLIPTADALSYDIK